MLEAGRIFQLIAKKGEIRAKIVVKNREKGRKRILFGFLMESRSFRTADEGKIPLAKTETREPYGAGNPETRIPQRIFVNILWSSRPPANSEFEEFEAARKGEKTKRKNKQRIAGNRY